MKVTIKSCNEYKKKKVASAVKKVLKPLGGINSFVLKGQRVLIKPNLLSATKPNHAITTHPLVIESVIDLVKKVGGKPIIADSPGGSTPYTKRMLKRVYKKTGLQEIAERTGAELNFNVESFKVSNPKGSLLKRFNLIKPAKESDVIINIPKLKTHVFTTFSGSIKNLFGLIPGAEKPAFHAKLKNLNNFSKMLLDINDYVKPSLNLIDGIIGLQGDGPGKHGEPKRLGALIAGKNSIAVDIVACKMIGINPKKVPYLKNLKISFDDIEIIGDLIKEDFKKPSNPIDSRGYVEIKSKFLQKFIHWFLKSAFTKYPQPKKEVCKMCGACVRTCPVNAIKLDKEKGVAVVDKKKCIRCFCCHEQCPHAAIDLKSSLLNKIIRR